MFWFTWRLSPRHATCARPCWPAATSWRSPSWQPDTLFKSAVGACRARMTSAAEVRLGSPCTVISCWPAATSWRSQSWHLRLRMLWSRTRSSSRQPGPSGHGSPCTVISSACCVCAAMLTRCDVLTLSKLVLSKLASRAQAPDAPEQDSLFTLAAGPVWPRLAVYWDLPGMQHALSLCASCNVLALSTLSLSTRASQALDAPEQDSRFTSAAGPVWPLLTVYCDLLGMRPAGPLWRPGTLQCDVRAALRARCKVLALSTLALSKLASQAPDAPEPDLRVVLPRGSTTLKIIFRTTYSKHFNIKKPHWALRVEYRVLTFQYIFKLKKWLLLCWNIIFKYSM